MNTDLSMMFQALDDVMNNKHVVANSKMNPVMISHGAMNAVGLSHILQQYSFFSRNIVGMLMKAKSSLVAWEAVSNELGRNIAQELGQDTNGVSHYDLLCEGLRNEFDFCVGDLAISDSTRSFIDGCQEMLHDESRPMTIAGFVYAIEATAVGELCVVRDIGNALSTATRGVPLLQGSMILFFLDQHINDFEVSHKQELQTALTKMLLCSADIREFGKAFEKTLATMDRWWIGLCAEACDKMCR